jgi:hypothetical protein
MWPHDFAASTVESGADGNAAERKLPAHEHATAIRPSTVVRLRASLAVVRLVGGLLGTLMAVTPVVAEVGAGHLDADPPGCAGDCDHSGAVAVNELITGVNIALGTVAVESCPSFDGDSDLAVTVSELITAINNALHGCAVNPPTAPPTGTPTRTQTPTATLPTGPPDVSGNWREQGFRLVSSNCSSQVNDYLVAALMEEFSDPCDYVVTQNGHDVTFHPCDGDAAGGTVDDLGTVTVEIEPEVVMVDGCRITLVVGGSMDGRVSPTTAMRSVDYSFADNCSGTPSCTIQFETTWMRR